jgi:hypothetical protein
VSAKAQTRSPKSEGRKKAETRNPKCPSVASAFGIRYSVFGLLSGFGPRISDLGGWRRVLLSSTPPGSLPFPAHPERGRVPARKKGGPLPRAGRIIRTNHYENQVGALLLAAGLWQFNMRCHYADGGIALFIQWPAKAWVCPTWAPRRGPQLQAIERLLACAL